MNNMFNHECYQNLLENQTVSKSPASHSPDTGLLPPFCHLNQIRMFKGLLPLAMPDTAASTATIGQNRSNNF